MSEEQHVIKLAGLPFSATTDDVARFLAGLDIKGGRHNGIHFTKDKYGRPSGECYVEMMSAQDLSAALEKDHQYIGNRWVSVQSSSLENMERDIARDGQEELDNSGEFIVKVRGLPWSASASDIAAFFHDCSLLADANESIHIMKNSEGQPTGIAIVELGSSEELQKALKHDKEYMGKRYLELSRSNREELNKLNNIKSHYANYGKEPILMLRGLPFSSTEQDVYDFFAGISVVNLEMVYENGRPMGKCFVEFSDTKEADKAMSKFGEKIGSRYIEIFQSSSRQWGGRGRQGFFDDGPGGYESRGMGGGGRMGGGGGVGGRHNPYAKPGQQEMGGYRGGRMKQMDRGGYGMGGGGGGGYNAYQSYNDQQYYADSGVLDQGAPGVGGGAVGGVSGGGRGTTPSSGGAAGGLAGKHIVVVKGVSLDTSIGDVIKFFMDVVTPKNVEMKYGQAIVELENHADAIRAMIKDKESLGAARVQLELQSRPLDYTGYDNFAGQTQQQIPPAESYGRMPLMGGGAMSAASDPRQSAGGGGGFRW